MNKLLLFAGILFLANSSGAVTTDSLTCKFDETRVMTASFDAQTGEVSVVSTIDGVTSNYKGVEYNSCTNGQVKKDEVLIALAQAANVNVEDVESAAVFMIQKESDAQFAIVKFLGPNAKFLGAAALAGWSILPCLP